MDTFPVPDWESPTYLQNERLIRRSHVLILSSPNRFCHIKTANLGDPRKMDVMIGRFTTTMAEIRSLTRTETIRKDVTSSCQQDCRSP